MVLEKEKEKKPFTSETSKADVKGARAVEINYSVAYLRIILFTIPLQYTASRLPAYSIPAY